MKVAFFSSGIPNQGGGISTYMLQMANALNVAGHKAVFFTSRIEGRPEIEETDAATIYRICARNEMRGRNTAQIALELAANLHVDLIEGADHLGECATLLKISRNVPVMIKVHCSNAVRVLHQSEALYPWQKLMIRLAHLRNLSQVKAEILSIRKADLLCAPSKRLIQELKKQSIYKNRSIGLIPNPFSPMDFPRSEEGSAPMILFAGRMSIGKGITYLPRIMEEVWNVVPECRLVIAGSDSYARGLGSLKDWLIQRFHDDISKVSFAGNLSTVDLVKMYDTAWVVIIPSRWDNFPSVALESMAREKPIVASPHGGMPEMLENTRNIIAAPECEDFPKGICTFLRNKSFRQSAGINGLKRLKRVYAPKVVADVYVSFVEQALISSGLKS